MHFIYLIVEVSQGCFCLSFVARLIKRVYHDYQDSG